MKIVFVTGATSGFGAAIARRFANAGANVIAAGRRFDRLEPLRAEFGERLHAIGLDVRDRAAVAAAVAGLPAEFAEIDVLVNNAGLAARPRARAAMPISTTGTAWSIRTSRV
jgi:3-hydroxy acid dehydrogenase/malonic semialdehyde reductase